MSPNRHADPCHRRHEVHDRSYHPDTVSSSTARWGIMTTSGPLAFSLVLFASLSAMPSRQVRPQATLVIDDPEAYAVYAAVVPRRSHSDDKALTNMAVLQETAGPMDCLRDRGSAIRPEWRSAVASYRTENARVRFIQPGFNLGVPYSLVTLAELRKLMQDAGYSKLSPRSNAPGSKVFGRFPGGRLIALSAVGFNADRTRAVVTVQYNYFPSLEPGTESPKSGLEGHTLLMENKDGRWVQAPVPGGCTWIA